MSRVVKQGLTQDPTSPEHGRITRVDQLKQVPEGAAHWTLPDDEQDDGLDAYDRIIADSFPASDPPPGPASIGAPV